MITAGLILVRHCAVAPAYRGCCYGASEVPLDDDGRRQSRDVAAALARAFDAAPRVAVLHSGLERARFLAADVARRLGARALECLELRERDFGQWELRTWDQIHADCGEQMLRMLSQPDSYRPGGGETTAELRDRVLGWYRGLDPETLTIAVSHGGPIASLRGTLAGLPVAEWMSLVPQCGEWVRIECEDAAFATCVPKEGGLLGQAIA